MLYRLSCLQLYASSLLTIFTVNAQQTFWPAALPIAVRGPYLNSWQTAVNGTRPNPLTDWTKFWTTEHITAWAGFIRVDNVVWNFLGGWPNFNQTVLENTAITPTRTLFTARAGPIRLNITFLSPVEPGDPVKQSFPFSYMYVDVESMDGNSHAIVLYTDISGEWVSHENKSILKWNTVVTDDTTYHQLYRQVPQSLTESSELSEGSTFYYAMLKRPDMKWQTGSDIDVRGLFNRTGAVAGSEDSTFRAIDDNFPVFAFSADLGTIINTSAPIVWAVGQDQDPGVLYSPDGTTNSSAVENRSPYWKAKYNVDISNAINDFLVDFPKARERAIQLDTKIMEAAGKVSANYVDLVSMAARPVFASIVITTLGNNHGSPPVVFMKNTGNDHRVNPVEKIFAALPAFLYIDPPLVGHLLEPLLKYQSSPAYTNPYAAPDLGPSFPNATGNSQSHNEKLEQSANMLIIAFAHARYTGDGTLLGKYYTLFKKWAEYITANTLYPNNQSADSINQSNNTNLAIKGILAIKAMSEISKAVGSQNDTDFYSNQAADLIGQWRPLATANSHLTLFYGNLQSDGLVYNLYVDKLLQTNLIPEEVFSMQASYHAGQIVPRFGPVFNSEVPDPVTNAPWVMFTAAALKDYLAPKTFLDAVHLRAGTNSTSGAFPMMYKPDTGENKGGDASPASGAMFSFLALDLEAKNIVIQPDPQPTRSPSAGVIAGAVIGSVAGISFLILAGVLLWRKRKGSQDANNGTEYNPEHMLAPQFPAMSPVDSSTTPVISVQGSRKRRSGPSPPPVIPMHQSTTSLTTLTMTSPATSSVPATRDGRDGDSTAEALRNEIADLRREVYEIREQRVDDPPPLYPASEI